MDQKKRTYSAAKLVGRVIQYMLHYYKYLFLLVVLCILITAVCTVVGATFPQTLVDDYITPMLKTGSRDFTGLAADLRQLACIMAAWRDHGIYLQPHYGQCEPGNHAPVKGRPVPADGGSAHQIL